MKKVFTTITMAIVLTLGASFAKADGIIIEGGEGGIIIEGSAAKGGCTSKADSMAGIIIESVGIIIESQTGIIIEGKSSKGCEAPSRKNGIIIEGSEGGIIIE